MARPIAPAPAFAALTLAALALGGCASTPPAAHAGGPAWMEGAPSATAVVRKASVTRRATCRAEAGAAEEDRRKNCVPAAEARVQRTRAAQILSGARTGYGGSW